MHPCNDRQWKHFRSWPHRSLMPQSLLIILYILLFMWVQVIASPHTTAVPEGFSADALLQFADQLLQEGEYFRAITEYQRFLAVYPLDPRRPMAHFRIGQAFYYGQSYADALRTFRDVATQHPETPYGQQAWLWQGETLLRQAEYPKADRVYESFIERFPQHIDAAFAQYQRGWTLLYRRQWDNAAATWQRIPSTSPLYPAAQQLAVEATTGTTLPRKAPLFAGILSGVLPGSGQLYNGRFGDAVLSFLLNSLFIAGTVQAAHKGQPAIAGVLGFFAAAWYTGNVYSAVNGAHKYNRYQAESFLQDLERRFYVPPSQRLMSQALSFQINIGF
jgi:TolA-binding protein/TM2 domain-containing membrane protein YozV